MAELHIIGEVVSGVNFASPNLFCAWKLSYGNAWKELGGETEGQSHVDLPADGATAVFSHPIQVHLATRDVQGWPKLMFRVYRECLFGQTELCGYGVVYVPSTPGMHELSCHIWKPVGTLLHQILEFFLGGSPELVDDDVILSGTNRQRIYTTTTGKLNLRLNVITRNFDNFNVDI